MIPFILSKEESKLSCAVSHENVCKLAADRQIPNTAACMHDMCLFLMETLKIRLPLAHSHVLNFPINLWLLHLVLFVLPVSHSAHCFCLQQRENSFVKIWEWKTWCLRSSNLHTRSSTNGKCVPALHGFRVISVTHTAEPGEGSDKPIQGVCISQQWAPDRSCLLRRIQTVKKKNGRIRKRRRRSWQLFKQKVLFFFSFSN